MCAMSGPFITDEQIARARQLAREITEPIFSLIDRNTTVSVERTVLRWFGVDGVGAMGAPLVNLMVDRLHAVLSSLVTKPMGVISSALPTNLFILAHPYRRDWNSAVRAGP